MAPLTVMDPRVISVKWVCFGERMRDCWPQKCECLQFLQIESPLVFFTGGYAQSLNQNLTKLLPFLFLYFPSNFVPNTPVDCHFSFTFQRWFSFTVEGSSGSLGSASAANLLDVSETCSEAWSMDVLASDTESLRLAELDNEDTASVARSDDTRFTDDTTRRWAKGVIAA